MLELPELAVLLLLMLVALSEAQVQMQQQAPHTHNSNQGSPLQDRAHVQDRDHIMEHYDGVIDPNTKEQLSDEELNFHYFKVHDYDHNNMLDGIELISALTHYHADQNAVPPEPQTDAQLASTIDDILGETDINGDGYIDYGEFIISTKGEQQQRDVMQEF